MFLPSLGVTITRQDSRVLVDNGSSNNLVTPRMVVTQSTAVKSGVHCATLFALREQDKILNKRRIKSCRFLEPFDFFVHVHGT